MLKNIFLSLLIFAIITFIPSFIGRFATLSSKEPWYSSLNRSSFTPPDWVFAPVWTTLYLFMTIAIWSVWHKNYKNVNIVYLYIIHLFFNTTWSVVFFGFHNILLALINSIIITLFVILLLSTPTNSHGPSRQKVSESIEINASSDEVWKIVSDFNNFNWNKSVEKISASSNDVGAERTIFFKSG